MSIDQNPTNIQSSSSENIVPPSQANSESPELIKWQKTLLPFMRATLALIAMFFFIATIVQFYFLQKRIEQSPRLNLDSVLIQDNKNPQESTSKISKWEVLSLLEGHAIERRYHQAGMMLMARVWIMYLGFITGMILAIVGATFILGKLRESSSTLGADSVAGTFSLQTASPGLILSLLGTILMITTMVARPEINVIDVPLYITESFDLSNESLNNNDNIKSVLTEAEEALKAKGTEPTKKKLRSPEEILSDIDNK